MTCCVYVIEADGAVKIGLSNSPERRMAGLSTALAARPTLCHQWRFAGRAEAERIERQLHHTFRSRRLRGEWFGVSPAEVIGVGESVVRGEDAAERVRAYRQHGKFAANWLRRETERRSGDSLTERSWRLLRLSTDRLRAAGMLFNPWDGEPA